MESCSSSSSSSNLCGLLPLLFFLGKQFRSLRLRGFYGVTYKLNFFWNGIISSQSINAWELSCFGAYVEGSYFGDFEMSQQLSRIKSTVFVNLSLAAVGALRNRYHDTSYECAAAMLCHAMSCLFFVSVFLYLIIPFLLLNPLFSFFFFFLLPTINEPTTTRYSWY
ncbi:hypothetical protein EDC01DRAFT_82618 [Geopyxis carbonaria]|nr:hypothetical protein EDC01DRAFT_82618 [Geopyxis carbonaria]